MKKNHLLIELETVDSTNRYAGRLLKSGSIAEGTVIFAHEQTSGKGQGENRWESETGRNATFSLVLFPAFLAPGEQFSLNKAIVLGILDFLLSCQPDLKCSIKWPNDIYAGEHKIGGILIENTICGTLFESSIAGIGFNVNQVAFGPGLPNPVSLKQITGRDHPVKDVLKQIVSFIDERYEQLQMGLLKVLDRDYNTRLLGINEWRDFSVDKMVKKGKITGVDDDGKLLLELENGKKTAFNHGEITYLFP
ncbi:MAG: biotin--[acetyl-CoA-carboxylase] ligase [Bacteroidetes bacterium]|nr:biotin--[acetyl-CoA-carboxylase] ligase [Bacteroidota bacterium]